MSPNENVIKLDIEMTDEARDEDVFAIEEVER
jgi:hypothetical protein